MPKRESLYEQYPDYRVDTEPNPAAARATLSGIVIAESDRSLVVRETNLEPVIYFPREDVHLHLAERSSHESFCPFKGVASYWTFGCTDPPSGDVAWSYEDPFAEVAKLKDYVAFYADRVEISTPV